MSTMNKPEMGAGMAPSTQPSAEAGTSAAPMPPIVPHLQTLNAVLDAWATRKSVSGMAAAGSFPYWMNPQIGREWLQLQAAMFATLSRHQRAWWLDWEKWIHECGEIRRTSTVSTLVEQDLDLAMQFAQIASDQAKDFVGLVESFAFNADYWASERLGVSTLDVGSGQAVSDRTGSSGSRGSTPRGERARR